MLFLLVSLRGGHSKCDKGKIRSYTIFFSGVHAFRLMRLMTLSVDCEVQYWTSVDPNSHDPGASVQRGGPSEEQRGGSGGMEGSYFAPITNSVTSVDIKGHQNSLGKWGIRGRGKCVDGRERAPFLSDTDCLNSSQPAIRNRATSQVWRRKGFGPEIEIGVCWEPHWHKYR